MPPTSAPCRALACRWPSPQHTAPSTAPLSAPRRSLLHAQVAETFNDAAVKSFKEKDWQKCYDLASEAIRLNPRKKE